MRASEIFKPNDFPTHTYVERQHTKLEQRLLDALETTGEIISLSGPSKSGKTVLVEKVIGTDLLIPITGIGSKSVDDVWNKVLNWMGGPVQKSTSETTGKSFGGTISGEGKLKAPLVGEVTGKGDARSDFSKSKTTTSVFETEILSEIKTEIAGSDFLVFIDDFHYLDRPVQIEVAKSIKEAARDGVKVCVASVPHRSDDVVRSNPELRGRIRAVDFDYWDTDDLIKIGQIGFPKLNVNIEEESLRKLANECSGSPQLMQAVCLQTCFFLGVREKKSEHTSFNLSEANIKDILEETSSRTDFATLLKNLHSGPKKRGTERKDYNLSDGSKGDVYRVILLSMANGEPKLTFRYEELQNRIQNVCVDEKPQPPSIYQACNQISNITIDLIPDQRIIEWDNDNSILDISDPYFLFYLRWSPKLSELGGISA